LRFTSSAHLLKYRKDETMPTIDDTWQYFAALAVLYGVPVGFGVGVLGGLAYGIGSDIAGGLRALRPFSLRQYWPL